MRYSRPHVSSTDICPRHTVKRQRGKRPPRFTKKIWDSAGFSPIPHWKSFHWILIFERICKLGLSLPWEYFLLLNSFLISNRKGNYPNTYVLNPTLSEISFWISFSCFHAIIYHSVISSTRDGQSCYFYIILLVCEYLFYLLLFLKKIITAQKIITIQISF